MDLKTKDEYYRGIWGGGMELTNLEDLSFLREKLTVQCIFGGKRSGSRII